ncbi:MAG: DUF5663 domain-containing protein [Patescibacteria group bacterium]
MASDSDKLQVLDARNLKAAALFDTFSLEEMEKILATDIFELMGVSGDLSEEQKSDLIKVFQDTVENRVLVRIMDSLSDADTTEFSKILEENPEKADQFLDGKGINKDQIALVEMVLYKLELAKKDAVGEAK